MAIRFYRKGDSADLAQQVIAILQSPELQHEMAEHNFAAGVKMTMTSVVKNYLRWFSLHRYRREIYDAAVLGWPRRLWLRLLQGKGSSPTWSGKTIQHSGLRNGLDAHNALPSAQDRDHAADAAVAFGWSLSKATMDIPNDDGASPAHVPDTSA